MTPPQTLRTARLLLRRPVALDADAVFAAYASDPEVTRYMTWSAVKTLDAVQAFLRRCDNVWTAGTAFPWVITLDERLIGIIEARVDGHRAELGYAISRAEWGRGYTTEAARAVVAWASEEPTIRRVWAYVDAGNTPSYRVLEKVGLAREALLRKWYVPTGFGVPRDSWMYARIFDRPGPLAPETPRFPAAVASTVEGVSPALRASATRLETPNLVLRAPTVHDAAVVFSAYATEPDVSRYTTWAPHRSLDDTRAFLRSCEQGWERGTVLSWAILLRDRRQLIGTIDIRFEGHRAEIGYVIAKPAWGHGYAAEAARAVVAWAASQRFMHRVWAVCDVENVRSARVLEKAGMTREGTLRAWAVMPAFPTPRDVFCYARVSEATWPR
jgi:RimJ/RimL family protein N-acetyltransferase